MMCSFIYTFSHFSHDCPNGTCVCIFNSNEFISFTYNVRVDRLKECMDMRNLKRYGVIVR